MHVTIKYCVPWDYSPQATSLAAALKASFVTEAQLIKGSGGVFDVTVEGELIFSKHDQNRFPTNEEIVRLIKAKTA